MDNAKHTGKIDHAMKLAYPILTPCPEQKSVAAKTNVMLTVFAIFFHSVFVIFGVIIMALVCKRFQQV